MLSPSRNERFVRTLRRQRTLLAVIVVLAAAILIAHAAAVYAYRMSLGDAPIARRASYALTAARIEPFRAEYVAHSDHLRGWAAGARLLDSGDYNRAVAVLSAALGTGPDEPDLVALYRKASRIQALETNKKAHLQHGHEGPGGTLRPEDIER